VPHRVEVVLYVDDDDPSGDEIDHPTLTIHKVVGPPVTMGAANSACLARASGDILVLANDDVVVRSPAWDARLRAIDRRFSDGIYLAWPNDGFASHRISTFPVLSRRSCELLGEPYPSVYRSAFIDYELFDIYTRLKRRAADRMVYLNDVMFEHRHHRTGKRDLDDTSRRHVRFGDDATFLSRTTFRQQQAERLAAAIRLQEAPPASLPTEVTRMPDTLAGALRRFARIFLIDRGLPWRRRLYLFVWFCGRYVAARAGTRQQLLPQL
jgi:hypothetical protein